ncbi:MAG: sigma-70 family RNA polymerase sigma factor [Caldilineaceae bacterium]
MDSLQQWIRDAQAGDLAAFGELVRRFQDMAVGYAYTILHDAQLAEDAAQEALMEAHRALPQLREPNAFPAWLRRIVFKQCDRLTRGKQVHTVELTDALAVIAAEQPEVRIEVDEIHNELHRAIQGLPNEERTVLTLFYMSDYSHKQIAAFLELPPATVNNRLRRARKRLQERMMEMVQANLHEQRPSRNDDFAARVLRFINAADAGHVDEVTALLTAHPELVDVKGQARYSTREVRALHYALNYGHTAVIEQLLAAGAEINAKADERWAPIHYALRGAHPELAHLLLARGAQVDIYAAAGLGDLGQVQQLVTTNPACIQQRGPGGATPLHFAITAPVADYLLAQGAAVDALDDRGRTPLQWQARQPAVVAVLLAHGAVVNDIFLACAVGDPAQVAYFLESVTRLVHRHKDRYRAHHCMWRRTKGGSTSLICFCSMARRPTPRPTRVTLHHCMTRRLAAMWRWSSCC